MFYINHGSDNFTIIDCDLSVANVDRIIGEIRPLAAAKGITRFICTHPDEDHFGGIELLDAQIPISNFYVVKNRAKKARSTPSFERYCALRDGPKAFYIHQNCTRKWMNLNSAERKSSGIDVLWPNTSNPYFIEALQACDEGESFNNTSAILRYSLNGGASFMWLGDLETEFMESIADDVALKKTTVLFAAHHGRDSGKIPDSWLRRLDPQYIVIGEAPSRHLNYYTGYKTFTQNSTGDLTFDLEEGKVHVYASNANYRNSTLRNEYRSKFVGYIGSFDVEREYTL